MYCVLKATTSPGAMGKAAPPIQLVRLIRSRCATITPLGRPVVPEVYMT